MNRFIRCCLVFFASTGLKARAEDPCARTVVINLNFAFNRYASDRLPGARADMQLYSALLGNGKANQNFQDVRLQSEADKAKLLAQIQQATRNHDVVQFNFVGHGLRAFTSDQVNRQRQHRLNELRSHGGRVPLTNASDGQESAPEFGELILPSEQFRTCQLRCNQGYPARCRAEIAQSSPGQFSAAEIDSMCRVASQDVDLSDGCSRGCTERYAITMSDLSRVFAGKEVFGLIDTCYSGSVKSLRHGDYTFLASASRNDLVAETASGGALSHFYLQPASEDLCHHDRNRDGHLNFAELQAARRVDPDFATPDGSRLVGPRVGNRDQCVVSTTSAGCSVSQRRSDTRGGTHSP